MSLYKDIGRIEPGIYPMSDILDMRLNNLLRLIHLGSSFSDIDGKQYTSIRNKDEISFCSVKRQLEISQTSRKRSQQNKKYPIVSTSLLTKNHF